jgi:hypothetical protein
MRGRAVVGVRAAVGGGLGSVTWLVPTRAVDLREVWIVLWWRAELFAGL